MEELDPPFSMVKKTFKTHIVNVLKASDLHGSLTRMTPRWIVVTNVVKLHIPNDWFVMVDVGSIMVPGLTGMLRQALEGDVREASTMP